MYIYKKRKKVKLINHDCIPILMLLHIMLYIMLAYLLLFAALSNAVCLYNASFCSLFFGHLFLQVLLVFMLCLCLLIHSLFISCVNLHSAFNLLGFPNSMFTSLLLFFCLFFNERAMCSPEK